MKSITLLVTLVLLSFLLVSCKNKENDSSINKQDSINNELKKKEIELKEKELQLKEQEINKQDQNESTDKNKKQTGIYSNVDLNDMWYGSIKNGVNWEVEITGFNGKSFHGENVIYWENYPEGYRTKFKGTFDSETGKVEMYEDRSSKGSGKFIGHLSKDGYSMNGTWHRYSDNGSFIWDLNRLEDNP